MKFKTYEEWKIINESADDYVGATVLSPISNLKKGDLVKVNALQYTSRGSNDKVNIITSNGEKISIEKKFLNVKL